MYKEKVAVVGMSYRSENTLENSSFVHQCLAETNASSYGIITLNQFIVLEVDKHMIHSACYANCDVSILLRKLIVIIVYPTSIMI